MRDPNDSFREVLRRASIRRRKRRALMNGVLAGGTGATLILLILWVALSPSVEAVNAVDETMGAFLLDMKAGGYVLVALAAFATGAFLTTFFVKRRADRQNASGSDPAGKEDDDGKPKA